MQTADQQTTALPAMDDQESGGKRGESTRREDTRTDIRTIADNQSK